MDREFPRSPVALQSKGILACRSHERAAFGLARLAGVKGFIVRVETHKVVRQFPANDQFLEECRTILQRGAGFLNRQCDGMGTDMTKVKIGGESAGPV